jgi:hypothetical protein
MSRSARSGNIARWRVLFPLIALVSSISLLTACGAEATTQSPPAVGQAFAAHATAVCQRALEAKQAWSAFPVPDFDPIHPDPSAFPKVGVWLQDQVAPTFDAWLDGLGAIGQPPTGRQAWSDLLTAVDQIVQHNSDQVAAAKAGNTNRFIAATNGLEETQVELEQATAAAGVTKCAEVHKE